ncbi:transposon Tf2-9 polyprotein [Trichonephila clavipes]|nr:transposon Tf2-9 polyprotein [Trichonephila clavipes]
MPPYNFSDPQLLFSTCERTFAHGVPKPITDTCTKFNYIISHLPAEAAAIVIDIIITPDETDPYSAIKAELIQRTGESSQQIRKLSTSEELGDREAFRTPQYKESAYSFAQRSKRTHVGTFPSAATDLSANYLGIHHPNNR